jgi:Putative adhesin
MNDRSVSACAYIQPGSSVAAMWTMPVRSSMNRHVCFLALLALAPPGVHAAEQSFTRTINLRDRLDLAIVSGAGSIQISQGPSGRVCISGHVKANDWHVSDDRIRDIAANPPIQQSGSIIRIGSTEELAHVSIDYEIEAPADSIVQASAGSGDIFDQGVGLNARFSTGSGNIHATGLLGDILINSNEGDIEVEQAGQGEVKVTSNSGNLELRNLRGALRAATNAGGIRVSGVPTGEWSVRTGKGDIELALGSAACTIDAQAGVGLVHSDLPVEGGSGSSDRHLTGRINGGGQSVIVQADEGEIHIH